MVNGNKKHIKTRINISISPELHSVLKELAANAGQPVTKFPAYILESSLPTFKAMNTAFKTARTNKHKAMDIMDDELSRTIVNAASLLIEGK